MINFKVSKCPRCDKIGKLIFSNNPIAPGICTKCLQREIDPTNLEQVDFFCRTYNLPFDPKQWVELYNRCGAQVFEQYVSMFVETTNPDNLYYSPVTKDVWKRLNEEWQQCRTYEEILARIEPIKDAFMRRCELKWGPNYTFEEYVQLENLLVSTMQAGDVSNPLRIDAIKKACKLSVELDKAIRDGDAKGIKDLSSSYTSFTKAAQLEDVIATDTKDVITTVAELGDYIEKCRGQFKYYDGVTRDIVDKTINDLKEYTRVLVTDATGLGTTLENIAQQYKRKVEEQATADATSEVSIQDLIENNGEGENHQLDAELGAETLDGIVIDEGDDDGYF